jgi:hypothetical protein
MKAARCRFDSVTRAWRRVAEGDARCGGASQGGDGSGDRRWEKTPRVGWPGAGKEGKMERVGWAETGNWAGIRI